MKLVLLRLHCSRFLLTQLLNPKKGLKASSDLGAAPRILDARTFAAAMPKPSDSERLCVAAAKVLASLEM